MYIRPPVKPMRSNHVHLIFLPPPFKWYFHVLRIDWNPSRAQWIFVICHCVSVVFSVSLCPAGVIPCYVVLTSELLEQLDSCVWFHYTSRSLNGTSRPHEQIEKIIIGDWSEEIVSTQRMYVWSSGQRGLLASWGSVNWISVGCNGKTSVGSIHGIFHLYSTVPTLILIFQNW
jgi:hypothetical protein